MILLFDCDGTVVDVSKKYFAVYSAFVMRHGGIPLSQRQYWDLKRAGASDGEILEGSHLETVAPETFRVYVQTHIELEEFLRNDSLFEGTAELLAEVSEKYPCYLLSMRRDSSMFQKQIEWLGIRNYFNNIMTPRIFSEDMDMSVATPKSEILKDLHISLPAIIVGDSGMDILTGRYLGMVTCAVTTGIRDRNVLERYSPHIIIDSLHEIHGVIEQTVLPLH